MKRIFYAAAIPLVVSLNVAAEGPSQPVGETPMDFAWGMPLRAESASAFYQLRLPDAVYQESLWPDLRDVRVFNHQGLALPFTLQPDVIRRSAQREWPLRIFALNTTSVSEAEQRVTLTSAQGVEVTLRGGRQDIEGQSTLLEWPEHAQGSAPLRQLRLNWARLPDNWQTRVSVLASDDLKTWRPLAADVPLMDLVSGSDRLLLNTIDLAEGGSTSRYLLLKFDDEQRGRRLTIASVQGIVRGQHVEQQQIALRFQGKNIAADEAEFSRPYPQPLRALRVHPGPGNRVMPIEIEYRSAADNPWQGLIKTVAYSVNGQTSAAIPLDGRLVQGIRLKGINQPWGESMPQVEGIRDRTTLLFNAQGPGPYLLVWGARVAVPRAITLDELIPVPLRQSIVPEALPAVKAGEKVVQGGESVLQAAPLASGVDWQKTLLWLLLIAGATGLLVLAFKLWRELNRGSQR